MRTSAVDRLLMAGFVVLLVIIKTGTVLETDVFWQVREGRELLAGAALERADTWSWSPPPGVFLPNSPAWAVIVGAAWSAAGAWGLWIVSSLYLIGCLVVVVLVARWLGTRWVPLVVAFLAAALCSMPLISPRSSMGSIALLMLATWFGVAFGVHSRGRSITGQALALLLSGCAFAFVGNWWHASWAALAAVAAIAWILTWILLAGISWHRGLILSIAGSVGLALGELLGPTGASGWARSNQVMETCRGLVTEWMGPFVAGHVFWYGIPTILMLLGVTFVVAFLLRRWWGVWGLTARDTLTLLLAGQAGVFALAGLVAVRFTWFAAFVFIPVLARGLSRAMGSFDERPEVFGAWRRGIAERTSDTYWRVILCLLLLVLVPFGIYKALPHSAPLTANAVELLPRGCNLFSTDGDANAVLLLRPDVRVWIDGRTDMWGRPRLAEALNRFGGGVRPSLVPEGTSCILLTGWQVDSASGTDGLVEALMSSPDWRVHAEADGRVIWIPAKHASNSQIS